MAVPEDRHKENMSAIAPSKTGRGIVLPGCSISNGGTTELKLTDGGGEEGEGRVIETRVNGFAFTQWIECPFATRI